LEEWKSGRLEEWKIGRMEEWKSGRLEEWKIGRMEEWKSGRVGILPPSTLQPSIGVNVTRPVTIAPNAGKY
jgi:hypothetical protein